LLPESLGMAIGTASGVVKRVVTDIPLAKAEWEVIRLDDGDELVGAVELNSGDEELVFITALGQLLHFPASAVRAQGRPAGGMAGIRLGARDQAVFFGALPANREAVVVTIAGNSGALPGTEAGSAKVTHFNQYPAKGRGTGGVRCHRLLKGEDRLVLAWAGTAPARAAAPAGAPVDLPAADTRRDGSGTPLDAPVGGIDGPS